LNLRSGTVSPRSILIHLSHKGKIQGQEPWLLTERLENIPIYNQTELLFAAGRRALQRLTYAI
jgi:hypothetical protein